MVTDETMEAIREGICIVSKGPLKRVEGDGYKVYRVGNIVRVDIECAPVAVAQK
jgi:hypothetical protein